MGVVTWQSAGTAMVDWVTNGLRSDQSAAFDSERDPTSGVAVLAGGIVGVVGLRIF